MRKLVATLVFGMGVVGLASQALAHDENDMPPGVEKLGRGLVNVAGGIPQEVISHTVGSITEYGEDTMGGFVTSAFNGIVIGTFWGIVRVGSGLVDIFTYPIPFDEDNSPLLQPDYEM